MYYFLQLFKNFYTTYIYPLQLQIASGKKKYDPNESAIGMLMNLRKIANRPLLIRNHFDNSQIRSLAKMLKKDSSHINAVEKFIVQDLEVMSDFDIHKTCLHYRVRY